MPTLSDALASDGALVQVLVGLSGATVYGRRAALRPLPQPMTARALLDTGADMSCLDAALIRSLGLPFAGMVLANLPAHGGVNFGALHDASLTIVHPSGNPRDNLVVRNLTVLEVPLAHLGHQVLIGRDLLARCHFLYSEPRNRFRLSY